MVEFCAEMLKRLGFDLSDILNNTRPIEADEQIKINDKQTK